MPVISISNSKNRDSQVKAESVRTSMRVRWIDESNRQAGTARIMKGTLDKSFELLLAAADNNTEQLAQNLINEDPELNVELYGSFLRDTSRVYVNSDQEIVHSVTQMEIVRNPDGSVKLTRPKQSPEVNVSEEVPLKYSGKLFSKQEVYRKFVIASKMQIVHINGLTYDFLFDIAKELEEKNSMLLLGAGPKGLQQLVLRRGAVPYRGFLEGRTKGSEYCLILHLSNMELKVPEAPTSTAVEKAQ
ncbi:MAG: hypothetical protein R3B84_12160 [Zavarzinella sp.]